MLAPQKRSVVLYACVLACLAFVVAFVAFVAQRLRSCGPCTLYLTTVAVPTKRLPASPSGGTPSNVLYTVSSTQAPFCLVGFRVSAGSPVAVKPNQAGDLTIYLEYIDSAGVSYSSFKLVDRASGGFSPQDLVVSQGSQICADRSLGFHATLWQAPAGSGVDMNLSGQAIVLTSRGNTITVQ